MPSSANEAASLSEPKNQNRIAANQRNAQLSTGPTSETGKAKIFLAYQRQLNNLSIQEGRLRRQREKDTAALGQLQDKRKRQAQARLDKAAREYILAVHEGRHEAFEPAELGFEFSLGQIEL